VAISSWIGRIFASLHPVAPVPSPNDFSWWNCVEHHFRTSPGCQIKKSIFDTNGVISCSASGQISVASSPVSTCGLRSCSIRHLVVELSGWTTTPIYFPYVAVMMQFHFRSAVSSPICVLRSPFLLQTISRGGIESNISLVLHPGVKLKSRFLTLMA
jgi:hypothetical protein